MLRGHCYKAALSCSIYFEANFNLIKLWVVLLFKLQCKYCIDWTCLGIYFT
uniref:Uncharacterized protein n=1 Tax=Anguilla anguilla TaxID=7936 RepID=A0A0E9V316_ANGAN